MAETPSPQPNLQSEALSFSKEFWVVIVLAGIAAGFAGGLLMRLLHAGAAFGSLISVWTLLLELTRLVQPIIVPLGPRSSA